MVAPCPCIDNDSHFFYWNGPNRHDLWRNGREVWAVRQGDWKLIGNPRDTSNSDARKGRPRGPPTGCFLSTWPKTSAR